MPVGTLLTGLIAPWLLTAFLAEELSLEKSVEKRKMTTMQQPTFNVNFYSQDTNNNQDKCDVHDNGNLNYQQGNSHLQAQGNLHHTRGPQRTSHYGPFGQPYPFPQRPFAYGPQFNPYAYPSHPYAHPPTSVHPPHVGYLSTPSFNPYLQPNLVNPNFASLANLQPQAHSPSYPSTSLSSLLKSHKKSNPSSLLHVQSQDITVV